MAKVGGSKSVDIAIFLPSVSGGGAEKVFLNLASLFSNRGFSVDILVASLRGEWVDFIPSNCRLIDLKSKKPSAAIWKLKSYLKRESPAVVLSALTHANIAIMIAKILAGSDCKVVLSERADVAVYLKKEKSLMDYFITVVSATVLYRFAHKVVAVSEGVLNSVAGLFRVPHNKLQVIYNPVQTKSIIDMSREAVTFPWNDDLPIMLSIGRLHEQKDFPTLLRAFSIARKEIPSHLVLLGEGGDRVKLEAIAAELDITEDVWLPGFKENPYPYMAASTLFVLSSKWEGLPNVLLEALSLNLPIVSTDCPAGASEILCDGKYGILVPVGNEVCLANAIIEGLRGNLPTYEKDQALHAYAPDLIADSYLRLLFDTE